MTVEATGDFGQIIEVLSVVNMQLNGSVDRVQSRSRCHIVVVPSRMKPSEKTCSVSPDTTGFNGF